MFAEEPLVWLCYWVVRGLMLFFRVDICLQKNPN